MKIKRGRGKVARGVMLPARGRGGQLARGQGRAAAGVYRPNRAEDKEVVQEMVQEVGEEDEAVQPKFQNGGQRGGDAIT